MCMPDSGSEISYGGFWRADFGGAYVWPVFGEMIFKAE